MKKTQSELIAELTAKNQALQQEINDQKKVLAKLQSSELSFQLFVKYAPAAIAMFDRDMRYIAASRRYISDYHLPTDDVIGRSHYEIFPDIPERWKEIHRRCLAGAVETAEADPFPRLDGSLDWVRWEIHPWYEANGQIGGIILFSEVITNRIELEQERVKLAERLDLATRSAHMGIWDWDIQNNELLWDEEMYALYGLKAGEFGGAYEAWLHGIHPDDREASNEVSAAAVRGEREYDTEFRVLWPDGSVHWLKANGQVFRDENGSAIRMVGVNYDITERKRAEDALRLSQENFVRAFENNPAALAITRKTDGKFIVVNDSYTNIMGYGKPEVIGHFVAELSIYVHPEEREQLIRQMAEQSRVINHELTVRAKNGEHRHLLVSMEPILYDMEDCILSTFIDITPRKHMEDALRRSEERFRSVFRNSKAIMFVMEPDSGRILDANHAAADFYGYALEQLIGMKIDDINQLPPDEVAAERQRAKAEQRNYFVFTHRLANGEVRTVEAYSHPIETSTGLVLYSIIFDITERKRVEKELRESRELFRSLFTLSPVAYSLSSNGMVVDINPAGEELSGYSKTDAVGKSLAELDLWVDNTEQRKAMEQFQKNGKLRDFEFAYKTRTGTVGWAILYANIIEQGGEKYVLSEFVDITQRKRFEEELSASQRLLQDVIDRTPALVYILDTDGRFLLINRQLEKLFGISSQEMVGRTRADFVPAELAKQHRDNDLEIFQTGQRKIFEEENMEPDGRHVYLTTKFPLFDRNGSIYAICGISTDMTARKQMEEELLRSNAELEQFAYIASHDLQEPLRGVAGMVQLLQKRYQGQLDERADEYINHAVEAAGRMQLLIQALLTYSRVERRSQPMEAVDTGSCLQAALKNLDSSIRETHTVVTADELPTVHADAVQLIQLFQNLIGNGIKFRGDEEPRIHISAIKLKDAWQFSVRDNGIGIESQYFDRIFLIFQRLHTRREYSGTGIGLALCKKIVERHAGRIWIESEPGKGSTFHFTLPMRSQL